jgi:lipopolysaccharide heptosyltransferase II
MLALATEAPLRVGFAAAREGAWLAYTHRLPPRDPERHAIERYLDVAEELGCPRGPVEFVFAVGQKDRDAVDAMLPPQTPLAVLLPGTNWATKRWPIASYARLAGLIQAQLGLRCVIAGGRDVIELAQQAPETLDLSGRTTLPQLVALLDRATLVIANDSGPMHIAAALGRPLVTIFGPTNPTRTGPYGRMETVLRLGVECSPCYSRRCLHAHFGCMHWLTAEMVLEAARQALAE